MPRQLHLGRPATLDGLQEKRPQVHDALTGGYASLLVDRDAQTAIFADGLYTLALGA